MKKIILKRLVILLSVCVPLGLCDLVSTLSNFTAAQLSCNISHFFSPLIGCLFIFRLLWSDRLLQSQTHRIYAAYFFGGI